MFFPSGNIALAGTLDVPRNKDEKLPSVLLVVGDGPYDRENAGLYTDVSHELAQHGFVVLRFDKRGIGKSQGENVSVSISDEVSDVENAFKFLSGHEKVDKEKLFIVTHLEFSSYLGQLDFLNYASKGIIMLGIAKPSPILDFESLHVTDKVKSMTKIDEKYPDTLDLL